MKVGDTVRKTISTGGKNYGKTNAEEGQRHTGRVIYVHPKGRFYTAEFRFRDGNIRESYSL